MAPLTVSSPGCPLPIPSSSGLFNVCWPSGFYSWPTLLLLFLFCLLFQRGLIHLPIAEIPQFLPLPQAQSSSFRLIATCLLHISTRQPLNFNLLCLKSNSKLFFSLVPLPIFPVSFIDPLLKIPILQRSLETSQGFLGHSHITILSFSIDKLVWTSH